MLSVIMAMSKTACKTRYKFSSSIDTCLYIDIRGITQCPHCQSSFHIWAVLKRFFISQGRKKLLTPSLTHHLRGHSASLRVEISVFCFRASLCRLAHHRVLLTRTVLWPPPFLPHEGGFIYQGCQIHQEQKWSMGSCWWFCHNHFYKSLSEDVTSKGLTDLWCPVRGFGTPPNADGRTPMAFWELAFGQLKAFWPNPRHQHLFGRGPLNSVGW